MKQVKSMTPFTPFTLPEKTMSDEYRIAIARFRKWAGVGIHLGDADPDKAFTNELFGVRDQLMDACVELNMNTEELYGTKVTYIANTPGNGTGECLGLQMFIDDREDVWVEGMSIYARRAGDFRKWKFILSETAKRLVIAQFLHKTGVVQEDDPDALLYELVGHTG